MQQDRVENLNTIIASTFVKSGEMFSVADIAHFLDVNHATAAKYLDDLMEEGRLSRYKAKTQSKNGASWVYSKKATGFISRKIRKHTDEELGICRQSTGI